MWWRIYAIYNNLINYKILQSVASHPLTSAFTSCMRSASDDDQRVIVVEHTRIATRMFIDISITLVVHYNSITLFTHLES